MTTPISYARAAYDYDTAEDDSLDEDADNARSRAESDEDCFDLDNND